jgi:hypothetical protein
VSCFALSRQLLLQMVFVVRGYVRYDLGRRRSTGGGSKQIKQWHELIPHGAMIALTTGHDPLLISVE